MRAPDLQTVYQFEDQIEAAVKTVLDAGSGITGAKQRDTNALATPRYEVQLAVGAATEHLGNTVYSDMRPDMWTGSLRVRIVTNRTNNNATHSTLRATCRSLLYNPKAFPETVLPYHQICRVLESATTPQLDADNDQDESSIIFNIVFGIRPEAWPNP